MLALIDNYDSFTYNLYQYLSQLGEDVAVYRNDEVDVATLAGLAPERIVISPGPSRPDNAGISVEVVRHFGPTVPVLGVCLGHQCIGQAYGGKIVNASQIRHGKPSMVFHKGEGLFSGLEMPFSAIRYHSLVIERESLPPSLEVTAWCEDGTIMGVEHLAYPVCGIQFHPESFMTGCGMDILSNFLKMEKVK